MPKYKRIPTGKPRGKQIAWKLTDEEQAYVSFHSTHVLKFAKKLARKYSWIEQDALSQAGWELCLIAHESDLVLPINSEPFVIQKKIKRALLGYFCTKSKTIERKQAEYKEWERPQDGVNLDWIDGKEFWSVAEERLDEQYFIPLFLHFVEQESISSAIKKACQMGVTPWQANNAQTLFFSQALKRLKKLHSQVQQEKRAAQSLFHHMMGL